MWHSEKSVVATQTSERITINLDLQWASLLWHHYSVYAIWIGPIVPVWFSTAAHDTPLDISNSITGLIRFSFNSSNWIWLTSFAGCLFILLHPTTVAKIHRFRNCVRGWRKKCTLDWTARRNCSVSQGGYVIRSAVLLIYYSYRYRLIGCCR